MGVHPKLIVKAIRFFAVNMVKIHQLRKSLLNHKQRLSNFHKGVLAYE